MKFIIVNNFLISTLTEFRMWGRFLQKYSITIEYYNKTSNTININIKNK